MRRKDLIFYIKSLGSLAGGSFEHKPLTIFCGPSNSGKTWAMYALHAFYKLASDALRFKKETQQKMSRAEEQANDEEVQKLQTKLKTDLTVDAFNKQLSASLADHFHASQHVFKDAQFICDMEEEAWSNWLDSFSDGQEFLMPAERSGLHLFYRELSTRRTALLHHASKDTINIAELLRDVIGSRYAQPIADYIDWLNLLSEQIQDIGPFHDEAMYLQKKLVEGRYHLDRKTGKATYTPYSKKRGTQTHTLELHVSSSIVKSLFGLWFYLEYQAKNGDILMIDEPELNVHPKNQLLIARLLARLVNKGIKVVISTHSDYIVREFNNLLLLNEGANNNLLDSLKVA